MEDAITWFVKIRTVKPSFAGFVLDHGSLMELRGKFQPIKPYEIGFANFSHIRYNCNRYDEDEARAARDAQERSRAALQRYLFYCNRYMNHMQSLRLEHKHYATVKEKMEEMQQHNMSWIEVSRTLHSHETKLKLPCYIIGSILEKGCWHTVPMPTDFDVHLRVRLLFEEK